MTKLNWDEYKKDASIVVDESLYLDEEEEHDTDIDVVPKKPLYKRVLKKVKNKVSKKAVLGAALASLVLAPIGHQKEPRDFSQRQPDLEQLSPFEEKILRMPVRVKRKIDLEDDMQVCRQYNSGACEPVEEVSPSEEYNLLVSADISGFKGKKLDGELEIVIEGPKQNRKSYKRKIIINKSGKGKLKIPYKPVIGVNSLRFNLKDPKLRIKDRTKTLTLYVEGCGRDGEEKYCIGNIIPYRSSLEKIKLDNEILGSDTTTTCVGNYVAVTPISSNREVLQKLDLESCCWRGPCDCDNIKREIKKFNKNTYLVTLNFWSDHVNEEFRKYCNFTYLIRSNNGRLSKE